jgi:hypothetical protein
LLRPLREFAKADFGSLHPCSLRALLRAREVSLSPSAPYPVQGFLLPQSGPVSATLCLGLSPTTPLTTFCDSLIVEATSPPRRPPDFAIGYQLIGPSSRGAVPAFLTLPADTSRPASVKIFVTNSSLCDRIVPGHAHYGPQLLEDGWDVAIPPYTEIVVSGHTCNECE